ncbi:MAG: CHAD domain-containing protein, partial [Bryobacteraceae bacterium]
MKQDEEAVHKMRVSIRRFVQGLSVFKRQVPHNKSRKALKQLRPVLQRSSKVRDLDLAILFLKKHRRDAGELASRREQAGEKLAKAVSYDEWKMRLHWGGAADCVANPGIVRAIVQKKLPPITADFFAAGRKAIKPGRTWHEMHKFRLAAK